MALMLLFSPHYPWYIIWLVPLYTNCPNPAAYVYIMGSFYGLTTRWAIPGPKMFLLNEWLYASTALTFAIWIYLRPSACCSRVHRRWEGILKDRSFSFYLPLLSLILWIILVAVPATVAYINVSENGTEHFHSKSLPESEVLKLPWQEKIPFYGRRGCVRTSYHAIMILYEPGIFGEMVSSVRTWPDSWYPKGFLLESWRSLTFPFFCLPMWWLRVGKGLDVVLRDRRLHWSTLTFSTLLGGILYIVISFAVSVGVPASDRTMWVTGGAVLWAALFAVFPLAWILQTLRRRQGA